MLTARCGSFSEYIKREFGDQISADDLPRLKYLKRTDAIFARVPYPFLSSDCDKTSARLLTRIMENGDHKSFLILWLYPGCPDWNSDLDWGCGEKGAYDCDCGYDTEICACVHQSWVECENEWDATSDLGYFCHFPLTLALEEISKECKFEKIEK